jgi:hypothetical protein
MIKEALTRVEAIPYSPHAYQERAIQFCLERGCAGLFLDPG